VGQFSFECCPLGQEISFAIYLPCFGGGLLLCLFNGIFELGVYFFALSPFSGAGCVLPACSADHVLFQFTVCFSVLQGSSVLDAALWLRR
jgi:hypothetical protein